jgi:hypothetical protein
MTKKILLLFLLAIFIAGGIFAQTDYESMPKNTIAVDLGPLIVGLSMGQAGNMVGDDSTDSSGFGLAAQYERQITENMSFAGKVGYLGYGMGMTRTEEGVKAKMGMDISSFTLEGHFRFYPFGETFFLDGMLGYGIITTKLSGTIIVKDENTHQSKSESISMEAPRNYLNLGAKFGWRIDFGGFVLETSLGYYYGFGLGDTIGKQLLKKVTNTSDSDVGSIDDAFQILENLMFIGGPRITISLGYRF